MANEAEKAITLKSKSSEGQGLGKGRAKREGKMGLVLITRTAATALGTIASLFFAKSCNADSSFPETCIQERVNYEACANDLRRLLYSSPALYRGESLQEFIGRPISLHVIDRSLRPPSPPPELTNNIPLWLAKLNAAAGDAGSLPDINVVISIWRDSVVPPAGHRPLQMVDPSLIDPLVQNGVRFPPARHFVFGSETLLHCRPQLNYADSTIAAALIEARMPGNFTARMRAAIEACLLYTVGSPVPVRFTDDEHMARAINASMVFRFCFARQHSDQHALDSEEAMRELAGCMESQAE